MNRMALALALSGVVALGVPNQTASASFETAEAKEAASDAAALARQHLMDVFGSKRLKPGQYVWKPGRNQGPARVVISLTDQLAFLYRGNSLIAVSTISSGTERHPTPKGVFPIIVKKKFHRSIKYDNAPMPHMQMLDKYGTALHGGHLPGYPASHGCVRLPAQFAARLFTVTDVGTPVFIGA
jgi:L,D-transpeptidase catalytic domain